MNETLLHLKMHFGTKTNGHIIAQVVFIAEFAAL